MVRATPVKDWDMLLPGVLVEQSGIVGKNGGREQKQPAVEVSRNGIMVAGKSLKDILLDNGACTTLIQ